VLKKLAKKIYDANGNFCPPPPRCEHYPEPISVACGYDEKNQEVFYVQVCSKCLKELTPHMLKKRIVRKEYLVKKEIKHKLEKARMEYDNNKLNKKTL
jgi:hypothetical protein